jgi:transcriptional regulator with XRE-family HTH domain
MLGPQPVARLAPEGAMNFSKESQTEALAANLRFASSYLPSVSALCRDIGLNRQQMNKYLSGRSLPSAFNLRRLAAYFGIEPEEMTLPPERFAQAWRQRADLPTGPAESLRVPAYLRQALSKPESAIERFLGFYHCYIHSGSWPGHITRYVMSLRRSGPWVVTKSLGRYTAEPETGMPYLMKCEGMATMQADLLTIIEQQSLGPGTLSTTILQPTYRSDIGTLTGVCADTPFRGRRPIASRIVLHSLGRAPDLRAAVAQCAIVKASSNSIDKRIQRLLAEPVEIRG